MLLLNQFNAFFMNKNLNFFPKKKKEKENKFLPQTFEWLCIYSASQYSGHIFFPNTFYQLQTTSILITTINFVLNHL